jgi:hypothetical protein
MPLTDGMKYEWSQLYKSRSLRHMLDRLAFDSIASILHYHPVNHQFTLKAEIFLQL